ncbi:hypothetical protein CC1G_09353 [Coprinopsis cinerea okayama7|uniref:Uncharacterized protein n=1 Tax=Coprinopsis cinerea (strain Okayama-7 / 130 / ATCC MYA-4618 / FGSC 9003) TaxID=240176 RepID=A8N5P8_COPC7|nr:hypothetical protein CC1G_09353 [Coprinopsis cinerea okayama7\|eukprot:XP_001830193.2 hypothetical protein CC1G_09353 [Coprinopsis cinerea okayama7\
MDDSPSKPRQLRPLALYLNPNATSSQAVATSSTYGSCIARLSPPMICANDERWYALCSSWIPQNATFTRLWPWRIEPLALSPPPAAVFSMISSKNQCLVLGTALLAMLATCANVSHLPIPRGHDGSQKTSEKRYRRILPWLGALYAMYIIDRSNLGLARIAGMEQDLQLRVSSRYSLVSGVYFIPNIVLLAAFYVFSSAMTACGAPMAYISSRLNGKLGVPGWSWIFILEGTLTMVLGLIGWMFQPGTPDHNQFLSKEHSQLILERIELDRNDSAQGSSSKMKLLSPLLDWKLWAFGWMYFCATVPGFAIG